MPMLNVLQMASMQDPMPARDQKQTNQASKQTNKQINKPSSQTNTQENTLTGCQRLRTVHPSSTSSRSEQASRQHHGACVQS